jgi:hypothetical protein
MSEAETYWSWEYVGNERTESSIMGWKWNSETENEKTDLTWKRDTGREKVKWKLKVEGTESGNKKCWYLEKR